MATPEPQPCRPDPHAHDPYVDGDGLILQCIRCRRVQRADASERWDRVPAWAERPPANTSGGICRPCFDVRFGGGAAGACAGTG